MRVGLARIQPDAGYVRFEGDRFIVLQEKRAFPCSLQYQRLPREQQVTLIEQKFPCLRFIERDAIHRCIMKSGVSEELTHVDHFDSKPAHGFGTSQSISRRFSEQLPEGPHINRHTRAPASWRRWRRRASRLWPVAAATVRGA